MTDQTYERIRDRTGRGGGAFWVCRPANDDFLLAADAFRATIGAFGLTSILELREPVWVDVPDNGVTVFVGSGQVRFTVRAETGSGHWQSQVVANEGDMFWCGRNDNDGDDDGFPLGTRADRVRLHVETLGHAPDEPIKPATVAARNLRKLLVDHPFYGEQACRD